MLILLILRESSAITCIAQHSVRMWERPSPYYPRIKSAGSYPHDTSTEDYSEYWYRVAAVDASGAHRQTQRRSAHAHRSAFRYCPDTHGAYNEDTEMPPVSLDAHECLAVLALARHHLRRGPAGLHVPRTLPRPQTSWVSTRPQASFSPCGERGIGDRDAALLGCSRRPLSRADRYRPGLLLAGTSKSGNEYCYECHGSSAGN